MVDLCVRTFVFLNVSVTDGFTAGLFCLSETDRHQSGSGGPPFLLSSRLFCRIKKKKNLDLRLAAIGSLLYRLYLADGYSLGKTYQDIGAWICCDSVWPPGPRDKGTHGSVCLHKKGLLCNWRMLVAWARQELAKALFPLWSCACAADLAAVLALPPDGNTPAPADQSWLRASTGSESPPCVLTY